MRQSTAKQFLNVEGLPLMWWTLRRFREALPDAEVTLVLHESLFEEFSELERTFGSAGAMHVVPGGAERFHSVLEGLKTLPDEGVVGIHDAVRPFPSVEAIQRCFELAARSGSAIPVVPVKDSIRRVEEDRSEAVDRGALRAVQTPQCFDLATLKAAFDTPYRPEFTDDEVQASSLPTRICAVCPRRATPDTAEFLRTRNCMRPTKRMMARLDIDFLRAASEPCALCCAMTKERCTFVHYGS